MLRVYGLLAALAAISRLGTILLMGPHQVPGHAWSGTIQGEFLVWFGIFGAAAGLATLAALIRSSWMEPTRPVGYPGLVTGVVAIVFYTDAFGPDLIRHWLN